MPLTPTEQIEAQTRAAFEKKPATPPPAGSVRERAGRIREEVEKKGPREAMKSFVEPPFPNATERGELMDTRLGWERGADGKKLRPSGSAAETTLNNAKDRDKLASELSERGYDNLSAADKTEAKNRVEATLRERIPDLSDALLGPLGGTATANKGEILESILKDPRYRNILRSVHREKLDVLMKTTDEQIRAAKAAFDEKTAADTRADGEFKKANTELSDANKVIDGFDAKNIAKTGTDAYRLDELQKQEPTIQAEIGRLSAKEASIINTLAQLRIAAANERIANPTGSPRLTTIEAEIAKQEVDQKTTAEERGRKQALLTEKANLIAKRDKAEEDKRNLEEKLEEIKTRKDTSAREKAAAQAAFEQLKLGRQDDEAGYVRGLNESIREATAKLVQEKLEQAQSVEAEVLAAEAKETGDAAQKKVLETLSKAGLKANKKGQYELDKAEAIKLGPDIIKSGLDAKIEEWLKAGVTDHAELARLTDKMKDTTFLNAMREKAGPTLIARYLQAGGRFTEGDVTYLRGTEWGQKLIENGIKARDDLRQEIEKLKGQGAIEKNFLFLDHIKSLDNKKWLKILLLILAGVALVGAVPIGSSLIGAIR